MDSPIPRPDQRLNAPWESVPRPDQRSNAPWESWVMNDANDKADVHPFRTDADGRYAKTFARIRDGRTELVGGGGGGVNAATLTQKGLYSPPSLL